MSRQNDKRKPEMSYLKIMPRVKVASVSPASDAHMGLAVQVCDEKTGIEYVLFTSSLKNLQTIGALLDGHPINVDKVYRCAFIRAKDVTVKPPFKVWIDEDPQVVRARKTFLVEDDDLL